MQENINAQENQFNSISYVCFVYAKFSNYLLQTLKVIYLYYSITAGLLRNPIKFHLFLRIKEFNIEKDAIK